MKQAIYIFTLILVLLMLVSCGKKSTEPSQVEPVTFSLAPGTYNYAPSIFLNSATPGADIRYTTDGTSPDTSSTAFAVGIPVYPVVLDHSCTLKAFAWKEGMDNSVITSSQYIVNITTPAQSMVQVEGGTFNPAANYTVTLSSFYISNFEVTQEEYLAVMGINPSFFSFGAHRPVEQVSWFKAVEYCNRLSMTKSATPCYSYGTYGTNPANWPAGWDNDYNNQVNIACDWAANGFRLPTEMEWMFAARGGNQSHNYTYAGGNELQPYVWAYMTSLDQTNPVGLKLPNELGLYDMSGNVTEWLWDQLEMYSTYPDGAATDPHGPGTGINRAHRGGSASSEAQWCEVARRGASFPDTMSGWMGFRVCRASL